MFAHYSVYMYILKEARLYSLPKMTSWSHPTPDALDGLYPRVTVVGDASRWLETAFTTNVCPNVKSFKKSKRKEDVANHLC